MYIYIYIYILTLWLVTNIYIYINIIYIQMVLIGIIFHSHKHAINFSFNVTPILPRTEALQLVMIHHYRESSHKLLKSPQSHEMEICQNFQNPSEIC